MFVACSAKFWQYNKANFTQISYLCIHIHMCLEYVCILEYSLFNTLLIIFKSLLLSSEIRNDRRSRS